MLDIYRDQREGGSEGCEIWNVGFGGVWRVEICGLGWCILVGGRRLLFFMMLFQNVHGDPLDGKKLLNQRRMINQCQKKQLMGCEIVFFFFLIFMVSVTCEVVPMEYIIQFDFRIYHNNYLQVKISVRFLEKENNKKKKNKKKRE